MGNLKFGWSVVAVALATLALGACSTTPGPQADATAAAPPQPEIPARVRPSEIVGRWGYAAYHKAEDRARTEANARGQCKQPFVIGQGPNGGVMMYLADSSQLQELRLKGSPNGHDYIGSAGQTRVRRIVNPVLRRSRHVAQIRRSRGRRALRHRRFREARRG
jgi:hypothetical protein